MPSAEDSPLAKCKITSAQARQRGRPSAITLTSALNGGAKGRCEGDGGGA